MRRLKILIDMDSILVNLQDSWYAEYNREFNDTLAPENVTDWDVAKFAKEGDKVFDILGRPGFFRGLPAIPGAIKGVRSLMADGHEVYFLTSAPRLLSYTEKAQWLADHIPEFDLKRLIITYSKAMVRGDILFDDGPHNIQEYRAAWPNARIATIAYPYNGYALKDADVVVGGWENPVEAWYNFVQYVRQTAGEYNVS